MQEAKTPAENDRLPLLDLLRFVAAAGVLLYHYVTCYVPAEVLGGSWLGSLSAVTRYGYLGVNGFFMISGFVILWSALSRDAVAFAIGRFSRLYPSFWVAVLLASMALLAVRGAFGVGDGPELTLRTLLSNATMLPSLLGAPRIDDVYWTLELEIRFYALVFLILLFRQQRNAEWYLLGWLAILVSSNLFNLPRMLDFLFITTYGQYFVAGGLFYMVRQEGWTWYRVLALAVSGVLCVVQALEGRSDFITADSASKLIVPVVVLLWFAAFLMLVAAPWAARLGSWAIRLGGLTYPLYLTHACIGALALKLLMPMFGATASLAVVIAGALVLAKLMVMLVDEPARRPTARLLNRIWSAVSGRGERT